MIALGLAILAIACGLSGVAGLIARNGEVAIIGLGSGALLTLLASVAA